MEDYDQIEFVCVFDTEPDVGTYELLFSELLTSQNADPGSDEIDVIYWDTEMDKNRETLNYEEAARIPSKCQALSVNLETEWDEISIGFSKSGRGFPSYEVTPFLRISTWIYALQNPDDGHIDRVKQRRREFAEIHAKAADILDPQWGFGRRGGLAIGEDETVEDLATRTKPPLYEYNVFRPETVEAIGREQVLSAPAYYVEELDSGGVFMAVTEPPKQCGHEGQQCEEVADQLGLSLAKTERYH
ncbi:hypothetical protein [Haloarcula hispanica]|uniref:hypothetical protein n=1 Tax=Haloarcula hispanica TaxID=51589 RepID=UPI001F5D6420|nr:hypothetical protein [Haloarcula hispanica]